MQASSNEELMISDSPDLKLILTTVVEKLNTGKMRHSTLVLAIQTEHGGSVGDVSVVCDHLVRHGIIERPSKGWLRNTDNCRLAIANGVSPFAEIPSVKPPKRRKASWREDLGSQSRKAKNFNPSGAVPAIISKLPSMEMDRIAAVWKNATKMVAKHQGHPAANAVLKAISEEWQRRAILPIEQWFQWPGTDARAGDGDLKLAGLVSEGMLSYLDYHVGRTLGEPSHIRRAVLDRVFDSALPPVFPKPYMDSWGEKKSANRLRKMAETIAAFARNARRKVDDRLDEAIRQWEDDLEYLHDRYYVGRFGFGWPTTKVDPN